MPAARRSTSIPDRIAAQEKLTELWQLALRLDEKAPSPEAIALVNSKQTTVRFCLPTQLLGKLISPHLDVLCLQKRQGTEPDRWDPRSFCASVIVPWNAANQSVLGPSNDPYVGNPLRRPRLDHGLDQMRDRDEWEKLCEVLNGVQRSSDSAYTERVLFDTLLAIRDRLRKLTFSYVLPARISLSQCQEVIEKFLATPSGGDRGLAVAAALFECLRAQLGLYQTIKRSVVNASDAATQAAGDLECADRDGSVRLVVEVKERRIDVRDVQSAISKVRTRGVRELLLCTPGVASDNLSDIEQIIAREWAAGTNVYHATIDQLIQAVLPLLGEQVIRAFIEQIGYQLDTFSTQPRHRTAWKDLLDSL